VSNIDNLEGKQTIIKNLYEKFFKGAFPKTVEKLGIVYTPVECVDFIIHSVEDILQEEFHTSLTNENVHILDPFTGTGTFITRLLQSGLIKKEDMLRKYKNEIHCNEIVLLAYYIADVNIESVFHDIMKPEHYENYDGICLTDTFQLNEHGDNDIFSQLFPENSERLKKQKNAPVRVIIGNPPYSIGQKDANDNAQNLSYNHLDKRITDTYVKLSSAKLTRSLYDSYIRAFRWASDRIEKNKEGGVVAFVTNSGWIDKLAYDGFRKSLENEYSDIYVFDLKGAVRGKSGEVAKREGQNVFDIMTGVAITILVKNPQKPLKANIHYAEIDNYLKKKEKLRFLNDNKDILSSGISWREIEPNENNDWLNQRNNLFESYLNCIPDKRYNIKSKSFFSTVLIGVATNRDAWVYNYSKLINAANVKRMVDTYNIERKKCQTVLLSTPDTKIESIIDDDPAKIGWTVNLKKYASQNLELCYDSNSIREALYRPFQMMNLYYNSHLVERPGQWKKMGIDMPEKNLIICVSGLSSRLDTISVIMTNEIVDLDLLDSGTQCFPLYWYEDNKNQQRTLFDEQTGEKYIRRDGITDWILREVRSRYHASNITKEMIFYYVYGLLHSEDYRTRFAADLKKSLPRIPIVENLNDFMDFYQYGKKLADLHLNYESEPAYPGCDVYISDYIETESYTAYDHFHVDKMRFKSKDDKTTIIYNGNVRIENIPAKAYEYIVNGKSAIEWIVERYCVSQDKKSLIKNDCNDWAKEHNKPRYILDLLLSVINVSVQTVDIVKALPKLKFD
jgi:predicted helicase